MKNNSRSGVRFWLMLSLAAIGLSLAFLVVQVNAQNEIVAALTERLTKQGVPVKDITVQNRMPFQIEITLQSSSGEAIRAPEDFWYKHLVWREAALAHRLGFRLHSFTLILLNAQGEILSWDQIYLYPDDLAQQSFPPDPSELDDKATKRLITDRINLYGMSIDSVEVSTGVGAYDDVQMLVIQLSVQDIQIANRALPQFMPSLRPLLEGINAEPGTRVAICRIELIDSKGRLLLEYLWDLEIGRHTWHIADDLTKDWFPHPAPEETPSSSPLSTPLPPLPSSPLSTPLPSPE